MRLSRLWDLSLSKFGFLFDVWFGVVFLGFVYLVVCVAVHMPSYSCGGQRTTCESQFSLHLVFRLFCFCCCASNTSCRPALPSLHRSVNLQLLTSAAAAGVCCGFLKPNLGPHLHGVLVEVTFAIMKWPKITWPKASWGGKRFFGFHFYIKASQDRNSHKAGLGTGADAGYMEWGPAQPAFL